MNLMAATRFNQAATGLVKLLNAYILGYYYMGLDRCLLLDRLRSVPRT